MPHWPLAGREYDELVVQPTTVPGQEAAAGSAAAEGSTPAAFGQLMRDEAVRWEKLVKAAGIKLD